MRRILNTKLTFDNPYVIRAVIRDNQDGLEFFPTLQRAKKIYTGSTWAYSNPSYENVFLPKEDRISITSGVGTTQYWAVTKPVYTSYWAFKDEQDALQFRLVFGEHVSRVYIWDQRIRFTVIEHE